MKITWYVFIVNLFFISACLFNDIEYETEKNGSNIMNQINEEIFEKTVVFSHTEFLENRGQLNNEVILYYSYFSDGIIGFSESTISLFLPDYTEIIECSFSNANNVLPQAIEETKTNCNYFQGDQAIRNVRCFKKIIYENLWAGIDLIYKGSENGIKYEFHISPYTDPSIIEISVKGEKFLSIHPDFVEIALTNGKNLYD
ncbi:MAG: hypothetical protein ACFFDT_24625, partial [Candidatus Hodarchaeota archaeon]